MHRLRILGDTVLRQTARALEPGEAATTETLQLAMRATLRAENGRGIAAPQLGSALRMFLLAPKHNTASSSSPTADEVLLVINPRVLRHSRSWGLEWETCSSVPGPAATFAPPVVSGLAPVCLACSSLRCNIARPHTPSVSGADYAGLVWRPQRTEVEYETLCGERVQRWLHECALPYCQAFDCVHSQKNRKSLSLPRWIRILLLV